MVHKVQRDVREYKLHVVECVLKTSGIDLSTDSKKISSIQDSTSASGTQRPESFIIAQGETGTMAEIGDEQSPVLRSYVDINTCVRPVSPEVKVYSCFPVSCAKWFKAVYS